MPNPRKCRQKGEFHIKPTVVSYLGSMLCCDHFQRWRYSKSNSLIYICGHFYSQLILASLLRSRYRIWIYWGIVVIKKQNSCELCEIRQYNTLYRKICVNLFFCPQFSINPLPADPRFTVYWKQDFSKECVTEK